MTNVNIIHHHVAHRPLNVNVPYVVVQATLMHNAFEVVLLTTNSLYVNNQQQLSHIEYDNLPLYPIAEIAPLLMIPSTINGLYCKALVDNSGAAGKFHIIFISRSVRLHQTPSPLSHNRPKWSPPILGN